jgi:WD40 repeat protein
VAPFNLGKGTSVAFSPDGRLLAAAVARNLMELRDSGTGYVLHTFEGHGNAVTSLAFSSDGTRLASGSSDRTVRVWTLPPRILLANGKSPELAALHQQDSASVTEEKSSSRGHDVQPDRLREAVSQAFDARQAAQQAEVERMRRELAEIEAAIEQRERSREQIIDGRVQGILHQDFQNIGLKGITSAIATHRIQASIFTTATELPRMNLAWLAGDRSDEA